MTTLTTISAYAGGGDDNRQKAEEESSAALDDCDANEVEQAGFDCIAIATNDVEIQNHQKKKQQHYQFVKR